ncbi:MAG: hypothetical protein WCD44_03650 [Candidatus Babeliales bacterium]
MSTMHTSAQNRLVVFSFIVWLLSVNSAYANLSSLAKNDAYPMFSSLDPAMFLLGYEKLKYRNIEWANQKGRYASLAISPFAQNADKGKPIEGTTTIDGLCIPEIITSPETDGCNDALGDLTGRTGMIALIYGALPEGTNQWPTTLQTAREQLFPDQIMTDPNAVIDDPNVIDPTQMFGYFSFPLKYRKRGVRFDIYLQFWDDIGISIQTGVSSIRQTVQQRINLTTATEFMGLSGDEVNTYLMKPFEVIADEIGLDVCNFQQNSIEEIRLNLYWRHAYEVNKTNYDFPYLLIIPYLEVSGSTSPGKKKNPNKFFGVPFGNNEHPSVGFTGGMDFDFIESIEVGGEVGFTHFFDKSFSDFRVPTNKFQTTIFPFTTDVKISPGNNWHFAGKISAFHFVQNLSMYFQYIVVEHKNDDIKLKKNDPAFLPKVLEKTTGWKTKIANIGFNYDISPNTLLGFLWQAPLSQRNTYRSTTILFTFNATF